MYRPVSFGLLAILPLAMGHQLVAVATGRLAAGLFLSDGAYLTAPAKLVAVPLHTWCNPTSMLLVGVSPVLFSYEAGGRAVPVHTRTSPRNAR